MENRPSEISSRCRSRLHKVARTLRVPSAALYAADSLNAQTASDATRAATARGTNLSVGARLLPYAGRRGNAVVQMSFAPGLHAVHLAERDDYSSSLFLAIPLYFAPLPGRNRRSALLLCHNGWPSRTRDDARSTIRVRHATVAYLKRSACTCSRDHDDYIDIWTIQPRILSNTRTMDRRPNARPVPWRAAA
jgi:hypothetical protein